MNKKTSRYELPEEADWAFEPEDLMSITIERNGCIYNWGVPYKNVKSTAFQKLEEPYREEDLIALGGKLLNILIVDGYSIDFKQSKTGVQKLKVAVFSSETEDRQLLHKLSSEFRLKDTPLDRDTVLGTNKENE